MRFVAEARTGTGEVVLFDPEALPEDFDARFRDDGRELLSALAAEDRLFHLETGYSDQVVIHLYLDEPVPASLAEFCGDPTEIPAFPAPSGSLWFCGSKYVFHRDDTELQKDRKGGTRMTVPWGVYAVRLFQSKYPDDYLRSRVRAAVGPEVHRLIVVTNVLGCVGCLFVLAVVVALFASWFSPWPLLVVAAALYLGMIGLLTHSAPYRQYEEATRAVLREFPAFVAEVRSEPGKVVTAAAPVQTASDRLELVVEPDSADEGLYV